MNESLPDPREAGAPTVAVPDATTEGAAKREPAMKGFSILAVGVVALAFVLGYMVAASATPVGSVVIPAVFGLVLAAFGLLQSPLTGKDAAEALKSLSQNNAATSILDTIERQLKAAPMRIGVALICFSCGYMAGAYVGATARISQWFAPSVKEFDSTWHRYHLPEPPSVDAALYWIYVQSVLKQHGLAEDEIRSLYVLQSKDWTARAFVSPAGVTAALPSASAASSPTKSAPDAVLKALEEWARSPKSANPIANQPSPNKRDGIPG